MTTRIGLSSLITASPKQVFYIGVVHPDHFTGRENLLKFVDEKLSKNEPFVKMVVGNLRMGKTSLMHSLYSSCSKKWQRSLCGYLSASDLSPRMHPYIFCYDLFDAINQGLQNLLKNEYRKESGLINGMVNDIVQEVEAPKKAPSSVFMNIVDESFQILGRHGINHAIIFCDDIHNYLKVDGSFMWVKEAIPALQNRFNISFVFTLLSSYKKDLSVYPNGRGIVSLFNLEDLPRLTIAQSIKAITKVLDDADLQKRYEVPKFSEHLIQAICLVSEGLPWLLQLICRELYEKSVNKGTVTLRDFEEMLEREKTLPRIDSTFEAMYDTASDEEKLVLQTLSKEGHSNYLGQKSIIKHLAESLQKSHANIGSVMNRLVKKSLLTKLGEGKYVLPCTAMEKWIQSRKTSQHPRWFSGYFDENEYMKIF